MPFQNSDFNAHIIQMDNELDIKRELRNIHADENTFDLLAPKLLFVHIKVENIDTRAANIIMNNINVIGGMAVISKEAQAFTERTTDIIISGTRSMLNILAKRLENQQFDLHIIATRIEECLQSNVGLMNVHNKILDFRYNTYLMASVFIRDIKGEPYDFIKIQIQRVTAFINAGVKIIDINIKYLDKLYSGKEILGFFDTYIKPLIEAVRKDYQDVFISINCKKYSVIKTAIENGIDLINEVNPLKFSEELIYLIAKEKCPVVVVHNPFEHKRKGAGIVSASDLIRDIQSSVSFAAGHGIKKEYIIVDPGFGFSRNFKDNYMILKQLSSIKHLNFPIIIGLSKRSFFNETVGLKKIRAHISTLVANTIAVIGGANIIRVNNLQQALIMNDIITSINRANDV